MTVWTSRVLKMKLISGGLNSRHSSIITIASVTSKGIGKDQAAHASPLDVLAQRIICIPFSLPPEHESFPRI